MLQIFQDIVSGLAVAGLILLFTLGFLYKALNRKLKNEEKDMINKKQFMEIFTNKLISDKLSDIVFELDSMSQPKQSQDKTSSERNTINSINELDMSKVNQNEIMYRTSKNHGSDENFSIRTWYGINYKKLLEDNYKYICFIVKGEKEKLYFDKQEIFDAINKCMTVEEQKPYIERNSFDTYLQKSLKDNKWYVTRIGKHLDEYLEVKQTKE